MSDDVLTDGAWVVVRGVLRWVPGDGAPPVRAERDVRLLIACPTCRAKVNQTCKSKGGNPVVPHKSRLAPRLCRCGSLLSPKKAMCESCRHTTRQETEKDREQRQPTALRRSPGYMKRWREENREHKREYLNRWRAARRAQAAA